MSNADQCCVAAKRFVVVDEVSDRLTAQFRAAMTALTPGDPIFTRDRELGKRVASRWDTGMGFVNHPTWTAPDLPFGGIRNSGHGRELSGSGLQEFVNKKLVRVSPIDGAP